MSFVNPQTLSSLANPQTLLFVNPQTLSFVSPQPKHCCLPTRQPCVWEATVKMARATVCQPTNLVVMSTIQSLMIYRYMYFFFKLPRLKKPKTPNGNSITTIEVAIRILTFTVKTNTKINVWHFRLLKIAGLWKTKTPQWQFYHNNWSGNFFRKKQ